VVGKILLFFVIFADDCHYIKDLCYFCNMKLHIFNPEHDIALAFNRRHQTMPHAAQELRMNLGWIPALWAADGDVVLVDDVPYAVKAAKRSGLKMADVLFLGKDEIKELVFDEVLPWGWDLTVKTELEEAGVDNHLLPDEGALIDIRHLSNRRKTINSLEVLRTRLEDQTCGESAYITTFESVLKQLERWKNVVVKAPWSSSGRGIRYVNEKMNEATENWVRRILEKQGGVMVEPYYNKVKDFGMEFFAEKDGSIRFEGLSLFITQNGAYTGSLLASYDEKLEMLSRYIPVALLEKIIERAVMSGPRYLEGQYVGPFGVDMMIVARDDGNGFLLHPCVEINMRRTMGHVALALTPPPMAPKQMMRIEHDVNYKLKVSNLENNFIQTI
jgi:hypothetical protein